MLALAVLAGAGYWWSAGRPDARAAAEPPAVARTPSSPPAAPADASPELQRLKGRWVRTDGGYVVDVRSVDPSGKVDVGYLNPRPIHVARAEASRQSGAVKLFIELRDVNYPGSTYTLTLSSDGGQVRGVYYQAATGASYDVVFVRQ